MAKKGFETLVAQKHEFDEGSQALISSLVFQKNELDSLDSMKRTPGWRLLEKKIREELHARIRETVKDDLKINTLLALLEVTGTRARKKRLDQEIESLLEE